MIMLDLLKERASSISGVIHEIDGKFKPRAIVKFINTL